LAGISGGHIAVFLAPPGEIATPRAEVAAPPADATPLATISAGTEL
jgi:hypothetical protein